MYYTQSHTTEQNNRHKRYTDLGQHLIRSGPSQSQRHVVVRSHQKAVRHHPQARPFVRLCTILLRFHSTDQWKDSKKALDSPHTHLVHHLDFVKKYRFVKNKETVVRRDDPAIDRHGVVPCWFREEGAASYTGNSSHEYLNTSCHQHTQEQYLQR